jgi:hypothetical protein
MRWQRSSVWFLAAAWFSFVISFFLPATRDVFGWQAAGMCAGILLDPGNNELGGWFYYGFFTFANLLMLLSPALWIYSWRKQRVWGWFRIVSIVMVLYLVSVDVVFRDERLGIGYFLWTVSFMLLAAGVHLNAKEIVGRRVATTNLGISELVV